MRRTGIRWGVGGAFAAVLWLGGVGLGAAQAPTCSRPEFEQVVSDAGAALRELNQKNRSGFQDRLRQLKDKRGWSTEQFMAEAAPYVQDEKIAEFDQTSGELLAKINSTGEASGAKTPDCALLTDLRATMQRLVATQTAKWTYMFQKLDAALKK